MMPEKLSRAQFLLRETIRARFINTSADELQGYIDDYKIKPVSKKYVLELIAEKRENDE